MTFSCFNLVIEMLLISRPKLLQQSTTLHMFQSRNRDAFDFKYAALTAVCIRLFSFQSRNRDAFDFKEHVQQISEHILAAYFRFNLVIEMLLISRQRKRLH